MIAAAVLVLAGVSAHSVEDAQGQALALRQVGEPGTYCPLGGCHSGPASPWTAVAFGGTVLAIRWSSRSRESG